MNLLRASGGLASIGARMAFQSIEPRGLDRDRIHDKIERNPDSGIDRVRMIFDRREDGNISPELASINMAGFTGMFIGGLIGGIFQSKISNLNFRDSNEATLFDSNMDAKRKLQNESTIGFGKGAFRMGWRCGIFCLSFVGISTIVSKYRNKTSITDYSIAGMLTGALFKINLGIKGMISGSFFGALIGTIGGVAVISVLKLSGKTIKEIRQGQTKYIYAKDEAFHAAVKTHMKEPDILFQFPPSPATDDFSVDFLSDLDEKNESPSTDEAAKHDKKATNVEPSNK